jgi:hypothetical protein
MACDKEDVEVTHERYFVMASELFDRIDRMDGIGH